MNNLERYKGDLERLIEKGQQLRTAMDYECWPDEFKNSFREQLEEEEIAHRVRNLPSFRAEYQAWYSEAGALVRQLLPNRFDDFSSYYEKPTPRKVITAENYGISDYLRNIRRTYPVLDHRESVMPSKAIQPFQQQLAIVKAARNRFESSLFDIRQLVQADLFDSELEAAKALVKNGFLRAAGAVAGVVMESHLAQVCQNHAITIRKKKPTIGDFNNALKEADVIDTSQWNFNRYLGDIRNTCDHKQEADPTEEQVKDLVAGVMKLTKTLF